MKKLLSMVLTAAVFLTCTNTAPAKAATLSETVTEFDFTGLSYSSCDKKAAQELTKQPGTIKITSNAHSSEAAAFGVTFNWNVKQKDDCVMTVETISGTIGTYYSFDLVIQSSGTYQIVNVDGAGVYEIAKSAKNINMVYICNIVKHEFSNINLTKVWLDTNGEVITEAAPQPVFTNGYTVGGRTVETPFSVVFDETEADGFELVNITVNGSEVNSVDFVAEADQVYNIVSVSKEIEKEIPAENALVDLSKYGAITSHTHYAKWSDLGIWCLTADQSNAGNGYVELADGFFEQNNSVTIQFKCSGNFYTLTLTNNDIIDNLPGGVIYNDSTGRYEFNLNGGGQAYLVELN